MIDLHCHSLFSDGQHTPDALITKAKLAGLKALALTDHDSIEGYAPLQLANVSGELTLIPGIELSARWKKYDIHILGYGFDPNSSIITDLVSRQNESRIERALQMAECMRLLGIENAYEKACEVAGHKRVGRPHFAQVFVDAGMVKDRQMAFKRFLQRGKPAYVPTPWISVEEAVIGINQAGGQAVLAHPVKYCLTKLRLHELIVTFKNAGGSGMEVVSGEISELQAKEMAGLCVRYDLLASSGSDFHSDEFSRISLGRQRQLPVNCTPIWHQWNI